MKRIVLCILAAGFCIISSATDYHQAVRNRLNALFLNLDKSKVPTGFLYDYAVEDIDCSAYSGVALNDSNYVSGSEFPRIIQTLESAVVNQTANFSADTIFHRIQRAAEMVSESFIPICCIAYEYNYIREDAINNGILSYNSGSLHDVYQDGVWVNPYLSNIVMGFIPSINHCSVSRVSFGFSDCFFSNLDITNIEFDSGDGSGYHSIFIDDTIEASYSETGDYELKLKLTLLSGESLVAHSLISITLPSYELYSYDYDLTPDYVRYFTVSNQYDGGTVSGKASIRFSNGTTITNPLLIIEGYDPVFIISQFSSVNEYERTNGFRNFKKACNQFNPETIGSYDIIYVDILDYNADIRANADLMKAVINYINTCKSPTASETIVFGEGMGGLIARYALRSMEQQMIPHQCNVFISFDTPHLGANIPLGALYAIQYLSSSLNNFDTNASKAMASSMGIRNPDVFFAELAECLNGTSIKQMLINYVNGDVVLDNSIHDCWLSEINQMGLPEGDVGHPITNIAISNGGICSIPSTLIYCKVDMSFSVIWSTIVKSLESIVLGWANMLRVGASSFSIEASVYPYSSSGCTLFDLSLKYKKNYFWGLHIDLDLMERHWSAPANGIPIDNANGSFFSVGNISPRSFDNLLFFGDFIFSSCDSFIIIPTASSLYVGNGVRALTINDYSINNTTISSFDSDIPFDGFYLANDDSPSYHTSSDQNVRDYLSSVLDSGHSILGPTLAENASEYVVPQMDNIIWSTSDSSIATISTNGRINITSPGFVTIFANGTVAGVPITLSKRVMTGIPAYSLSALDGSMLRTQYMVSACPTNRELNDYMPILNLHYDWGIKVGNGPINWYNNEGLSKRIVFENENNNETVYFRARNNIYSSAISSIVLRPRPLVHEIELPINSSGEIIGPNGETLITRSSTNTSPSNRLIKCIVDNSLALFFDYLPDSFDICKKAIQYESFRKKIMNMKPWGDDDFMVISVVANDEEQGETQYSAIRLIYVNDEI